MAASKKIHFDYEKDGVKLNASFDIENTEIAIEQMGIFSSLCEDARIDIKKAMEELGSKK